MTHSFYPELFLIPVLCCNNIPPLSLIEVTYEWYGDMVAEHWD